MANDNDLRLTARPAVKVGMGIRKPPEEVFAALVDPSITTKFWFTKSSGRVEPGVNLTWEWEMYGAIADVRVKEVEPEQRVSLEWGGDGSFRHLEIVFKPWEDDGTYVQITESGFVGSGDEIAAWLTDSTGGFTQMLCALKALLEHDVVLTVVLDHHPTQPNI